jgi:hypothetical protein
MIATDHRTVASSGCCIGQTGLDPEGLGLSKGSRHEEATAHSGFQSATVRSHVGMPWVRTKTLEMNISGRNRPAAADTRDERFEFGLRCVLDGVAVQLADAGSVA